LQGAEAASAAAPDAEKAQFNFVKAQAHLALVNKNENTDANLSAAAKNFQEVLVIEKAMGKSKYSAQATTSIIDLKYKLINGAIADSKTEKHSEGARKLYDAYLLDKKDTINLYYAASTFVNKATVFYAVNKVNGQEQSFSSAKERDQMVKLGTHEKPRTEEIPSKRGEIYKNMALILVQNGKIAEAKKAVAEARATNPDDKSLILTEANLYLDTKDYDTYKKLITEVLAQSPNDADLVFNLGVISYNAKNFAEAETYYKRAVEIKPDYVNAYLNLAILKLDADKKLFEEIQKLGNSEKDNKRYDVLKKQREAVFSSALPYLEKAAELDDTNEEVKSTLLSVYRALEMTEKAKALKAKMKK
jgi:tetratricopeptide (TPR) repeat protein